MYKSYFEWTNDIFKFDLNSCFKMSFICGEADGFLNSENLVHSDIEKSIQISDFKIILSTISHFSTKL